MANGVTSNSNSRPTAPPTIAPVHDNSLNHINQSLAKTKYDCYFNLTLGLIFSRSYCYTVIVIVIVIAPTISNAP